MNQKSRTQKARLNISFSFLQQIVSLICGIIVPRLMLKAFGSEGYGAVSSITNLLSYIALLEGGIGAVTRSALYKAFAEKSVEKISAIAFETKKFYRKIAFAFILYVLFIAVYFQQISRNTIFSYWYSFGLVIVIAISMFAEYVIGISYTLLLQADQSNYVSLGIKTTTMVLNTIVIFVLINNGCDILTVKLITSLLFILRPLFISYYVKHNYHLIPVKSDNTALTQKRTALGQHIAWSLHNNVDITVLTIFKDLTFVSVYSVYNIVINQLQNAIAHFTIGMEAVFGSMFNRNEINKLQQTFGYYETLISLFGVTFFSSASVLIVPFVRIYTTGLSDGEYIQPLFALALLLSSLLYCMRSPYHHMVMAAGHFKQTRFASYGEASINIIVSIAFVIRFGLVGVAIGTVSATLFRYIFYVFYLSRHVLNRSILLFVKRIFVNLSSCTLIYLIGSLLLTHFQINNYRQWIVAGVIVTVVAGLVTLTFNIITYKEDVKGIILKGLGKKRREKL